MAQILCDHVTLGYEGQKVIEDLSFRVNQGNYLVIVGENGAGKSTLMKGLLHLKKPMAGSIEYGDGLKANEIGYLPQQTMIQKDFPASVMEVVISGRLNQMGWRPFYNKEDRKKAHEMMLLMGIHNIAKESYQNLSGGQQQRVLLARALCASRKMLLLDEPVSGLDPIVTKEMYSLIKKINDSLGITVIMISHDLEGALQNSSHILHLSQKHFFYGKTEDYLESPQGMQYAELLGGDRA